MKYPHKANPKLRCSALRWDRSLIYIYNDLDDKLGLWLWNLMGMGMRIGVSIFEIKWGRTPATDLVGIRLRAETAIKRAGYER